MSRDSGAGAYSNADGTGARSRFFSRSVNGEVIRALVAARLLFPDLHQHVVQERRRTEAEQVRSEPLRPERLVQEDEVLDGLLGVANAAGRLHPDLAARLL